MNSRADNEKAVLHLFLKMDKPELSVSELSLPTAYLKAMYAESFTTEKVLEFFEEAFSKLNDSCLSEFGAKLSSNFNDDEVLKVLAEFAETEDKSEYPLNTEASVFQVEVEDVWLKDEGWRYEQALSTVNLSNGYKITETARKIYALPYFYSGNEYAHFADASVTFVSMQALTVCIRSVLYMLTQQVDQESKPEKLQQIYLDTQQHHISALRKLFSLAAKLS